MRITILSVLIAGFSGLIHAQDWTTDFTQAKAMAKEKNRKIVLVFSGSDWCAPCIKLDKNIWSSDTFKAYAKEHYVMLRADFPRKKENKLSDEQQEKNNVLAEKYNQQGFFPLVVVMDYNGNVLGTTGYKKATPGEYIKILNAL